QRDGLQTGRAEAVNGHGAGFDGESGTQRGDARDVHALLAFGHGTAENYVVNFFGVEARDARQGFLDGQRGEIVGARGAERTLLSTADGSANSGDDNGFWHGGTSKSENRKTKKRKPQPKGPSYSLIVGRAEANCNSCANGCGTCCLPRKKTAR